MIEWLPVAVLGGIFVVTTVLVGAVLYYKQPGLQFGEAEIERLADALRWKQQAAAAPSEPLVYEGIKFPDQPALDEYKSAKAIVDAHKPA